ncbi:PAS domain-containing sensor histidine kinase [Psychrobium sp. 1_MG-2023]|uniref:sensor histidine kinase n=1 Tax=Psychrobium sp. 1_MG-2023 TaxID=3062624 RepID=UPI000C31C030|nr:ATP-binding protein [Psychrobium sp. 1_MG-2023]MDP2559841.1 ATP-binding protein [Psychrobium sp. 1_MG-2023]PKF59055.1 PAS domain-containing sensor histidine kinase [Alteromonadales bacterium alter-6D02]
MALNSPNNQHIGAQVSQNRLAHLVDILPSGVIILDGNGLVSEANKMAVSFLGQEVIGQRWFNVINEAFQPRADDGHEVSLKDGRRLKIAISSLEPEDGQLILLTDLTETRQMQNNMAHMQRLSALGKMVASLAHQVRTPLSAAMLYAANLKNKAMPDHAKTHFHDKLLARLKDLEQQVNDMLMFARSDNGQIATELSLQELLTEVDASSEAMMQQHKAKMMVTLPDPDLLILGNRTALSGAVTNLIHNAIQAKPQGLLLHLIARRFGDNEVEISLIDNGPGVSLAQQQKIFEPFFTTKSQGTGLGLAVVQSVAKSHNGKLNLVSKQGQGSCFSLILPLQREAAVVIKHAMGS